MSFCKYYRNSKCTLEGSYCDLNCNQPNRGEVSRSYDENDVFTQWQMEEEEKGARISGGGLNSRLFPP